MTAQIEKLRAELEEKTRSFLENGGKIDERRTGEATIGTHNDRDLRAETMTLEEVASASGLSKEYIKSLAYQKKMPQAAVYLDRTVLSNESLKFRQLRWKRSEIEAWLTKLAENKKQQRAARIERMRKMNTCSAERPKEGQEMTEFASIKIATYRHREHSRDGRLHGHCPVICGPRTYTHSPQRWRVVATVVHTAQRDDGSREADIIDMTLTMGGRDVLSYVEAYTAAQDVVQKHIDALGASYDQYFDLFVLVPKSVARAKALAKARRRAKR